MGAENVTKEERTFQRSHFFQVKSFLDRTHKLYSLVFEEKKHNSCVSLRIKKKRFTVG